MIRNSLLHFVICKKKKLPFLSHEFIAILSTFEFIFLGHFYVNFRVENKLTARFICIYTNFVILIIQHLKHVLHSHLYLTVVLKLKINFFTNLWTIFNPFKGCLSTKLLLFVYKKISY